MSSLGSPRSHRGWFSRLAGAGHTLPIRPQPRLAALALPALLVLVGQLTTAPLAHAQPAPPLARPAPLAQPPRSPPTVPAPSQPAAPSLLSRTAALAPSPGIPRPTPAPLEASILIAPPERLAAIASRLTGHRFHTGDHVLILEDFAGEGRPWLGLVAFRCDQLWLETSLGPLLLTGPLARPRIAGPGYLIWATGRRTANTLELSRLGILARPDELDRAPSSLISEPRCP